MPPTLFSSRILTLAHGMCSEMQIIKAHCLLTNVKAKFLGILEGLAAQTNPHAGLQHFKILYVEFVPLTSKFK